MACEVSGLSQALRLMNTALELIDASGTASDVGAHLDLAIQRLGALLVPAHECARQTLDPGRKNLQRRHGSRRGGEVGIKRF